MTTGNGYENQMRPLAVAYLSANFTIPLTATNVVYPFNNAPASVNRYGLHDRRLNGFVINRPGTYRASAMLTYQFNMPLFTGFLMTQNTFQRAGADLSNFHFLQYHDDSQTNNYPASICSSVTFTALPGNLVTLTLSRSQAGSFTFPALSGTLNSWFMLEWVDVNVG